MYEDLESIANLKIGKEVDAISRATQAERASTIADLNRRGLVSSGNAVAGILGIELRAAERLARAICDIWIDLIRRKNDHVTREDVAFVMQKVETFTTARASSLPATVASMPTLRNISNRQYIEQQVAMDLQRITGGIRRDLEIEFREREAFPHEHLPMSDSRFQLSISNSNIANLNLGSQVGTINSALEVISSEKSSEDLAKALKQITEAIVVSTALADLQKQEAVQILADVSKQAELEPKERSLGTVKAMLAYLPILIGVAADITVVWDKVAPVIKHYFQLL